MDFNENDQPNSQSCFNGKYSQILSPLSLETQAYNMLIVITRHLVMRFIAL